MNTPLIIGLIIGLNVLAIITIVLWTRLYKRDKDEGKVELQYYWNYFHESGRRPDTLEYYKEGMKVHRQYKIPFTEINCPDTEAFRQAAVRALNQTLKSLHQDKDFENNTELNELAAKVRSDLATLIVAGMDENQKAKAANTFVTMD